LGRAAFARSTCALTGRDAAKQNSRCAGTVRNSRIITTLCRSLKMVADDFRRAFSRSRFLSRSFAQSLFTKRDGRSARHSQSSARNDWRQTSMGSRDSRSRQTRPGRRLCPLPRCLCDRRHEAPRLH